MNFAEPFVTAVTGLFIGTLLGNEISRFLYRPRVIVKFKQLAPLKVNNGFFWSIRIANFGRTVASNCIGTVTLNGVDEIDIINPSQAVIEEALPSYKEENLDMEYPRAQLIEPNKFRELKNCELCWAKLGNPGEININPGTMQTLDVCRVQNNFEKGFWYLIFPSEQGWRKVRVRIKVKNNITGRILVCPSNEFPTILDFRISTNENDEPVFEPVVYGFFERIRRRLDKNDLYFG